MWEMVGWWGVGTALLSGCSALGEGEGGLRDMWTFWEGSDKINWTEVMED